MPKIEPGSDTGNFLIDGLPYQKGLYEPFYAPGGVEKFGVRRAGTRGKDLDFLQAPEAVTNWTNGDDAQFSSLSDIANYLQTFFFRNEIEASGESNFLATYRALNFDDISSVAPSPEVNETVFVNQSQGTRWVPGKIGGTYYPGQTIYVWDGSSWISDLEEVANALSINITDIESVVLINANQDTAISANTSSIVSEAATRQSDDTALGTRIDSEAATRQSVDEATVNVHSDVNLTNGVVPLDGWIPKIVSGVVQSCMLEHAFYEGPPVINNSANTPLVNNPFVWSFNFQRTGHYKVTVSCALSADSTGADVVAIPLFDGQTMANIANGEMVRKEGKDSGGNNGDGRATDQKEPIVTKAYRAEVTDIGIKEIELQHFGSFDGEASCWDVSLEVEEIFIPQIITS